MKLRMIKLSPFEYKNVQRNFHKGFFYHVSCYHGGDTFTMEATIELKYVFFCSIWWTDERTCEEKTSICCQSHTPIETNIHHRRNPAPVRGLYTSQVVGQISCINSITHYCLLLLLEKDNLNLTFLFHPILKVSHLGSTPPTQDSSHHQDTSISSNPRDPYNHDWSTNLPECTPLSLIRVDKNPAFTGN